VKRYLRSQGGYTLIEVMIASALGVMLMTALVSVVLTTTRATAIATSRVEASSQIRSFQSFSYEDFAAATAVTIPGGCGTAPDPCTTQALILDGTRASNTTPPVASSLRVTYTWDGSQFLDRKVGANPAFHAATNVAAFSWYVDDSGAFATVVVSMTVHVGSYDQSQTFRFYPRPNP